MSSRNPIFWALIGFGVGAVIATTGRVYHPLDSLLGGIIQAVIWFGVSSLIINKKNQKLDSDSKNSSILNRMAKNGDENLKRQAVKSCDRCKSPVPMSEIVCSKCAGTKFIHSEVSTGFKQESSEEALSSVFGTTDSNHLEGNIEFKNCPMCAEEVRFAAKKCRYCQHLFRN
jgi:hypothetical protein